MGRIRRPRTLSTKRRKTKVASAFDFIEDDEDFDFLLEEEDEDSRADSFHAPPPDVHAVANVTVREADAVECGVCFLALRPPIFQCEVGHVVCSACRDKLEATGNPKCHVCRAASGFRRCHAMERLVDCICVPCPYKAYGCHATPPYHGKDSHRQVCRHAPCRCPGESCSFIGSTRALLEHFAVAHNWPCTTKARAGETLRIRLLIGFNFVFLASHDRGDDGDQAPATCSLPCKLFLLNVTQERHGRAISVICIHPHGNSVDQPPSMICKLVFAQSSNQSLCLMHCQSSEFKVACTDLSNGLPSSDGCVPFIVPNAVLGVGDDNKDHVEVKVRIGTN